MTPKPQVESWKQARICAYKKCRKVFMPVRPRQLYHCTVCRVADWQYKQARNEVDPRNRSLRADVRNPILQLPSAQRLQNLPVKAKEILYELLEELSLESREKAEKCWRKHKAPMAAYWKAVAVYAGHAKRLVR